MDRGQGVVGLPYGRVDTGMFCMRGAWQMQSGELGLRHRSSEVLEVAQPAMGDGKH